MGVGGGVTILQHGEAVASLAGQLHSLPNASLLHDLGDVLAGAAFGVDKVNNGSSRKITARPSSKRARCYVLSPRALVSKSSSVSSLLCTAFANLQDR